MPIANLQRLIAALLIGGLAAGWLFSVRAAPWPAFYANAALALCWLSALLALSAQGLLRPGPGAGLQWPKTLALPLLALPLLALQVLDGQIAWAGDAWLPALFLFGFGLAQVLGASMPGAPGRGGLWEDLFAQVTLTVALLSALLGYAQWAGYSADLPLWLVLERAYMVRPVGNLAQANHLAMLLLWGLIALVHLAGIGALQRRWAWPAAVLLVVVLALTESRFVLLIVLAGTAERIWREGWPAARRWLPDVALLAATWLLSLVLAQWVMASGAKVIPEFGERLVTSGRLQIWAQLWPAVLEHPWAGWGWNQVVVAQYHHADAAGRFLFSYATNAHTGVLDLMLWCGIPVALLIMGAMLGWMLRAWRRAATPQAWFSWTSLAALLIYSGLEFPYEFGYFLWPAGWLIGRLQAQWQPAPSPGRALGRAGPALGLALALLGLAVTVQLMREYRWIEEDFLAMLFEGRGIVSPLPRPAPPPLWLLTPLQAYIDEERAPLPAQASDEDAQRLQRLTARYPFPSLLVKHARLLAQRGEFERARQEMLRIGYLFGARSYARARADWLALAAQGQPGLVRVSLPLAP